MTLGIVQKEIRAGLSAADVAEALGSPNIVTNDGSGRETWVYDKIASEVLYSTSSTYGTVLLISRDQASETMSTSQRTLTVVIKFDRENRVESFAYHASKF